MTQKQILVERFIESVAIPSYSNMHNPWRDSCATELSTSGVEIRQERLRRHLLTPDPQLLLIGEAPGYQGCRYSGLAFTSERLLMEQAIPRMEGLDGERITARQKPWSEPSATIVWKALFEHGLARSTILFNAVPWHPEGKRGVHSNRTPTTEEKQHGVQYLKSLLDIYPGVPVAALGNTASETLSSLGVHHTKLRHPANGGATKFRQGLSALI